MTLNPQLVSAYCAAHRCTPAEMPIETIGEKARYYSWLESQRYAFYSLHGEQQPAWFDHRGRHLFLTDAGYEPFVQFLAQKYAKVRA